MTARPPLPAALLDRIRATGNAAILAGCTTGEAIALCRVTVAAWEARPTGPTMAHTRTKTALGESHRRDIANASSAVVSRFYGRFGRTPNKRETGLIVKHMAACLIAHWGHA